MRRRTLLQAAAASLLPRAPAAAPVVIRSEAEMYAALAAGARHLFIPRGVVILLTGPMPGPGLVFSSGW